MCLTIHCQLLFALAHNSIAFFNTILPHSLSNANSHCYARNVLAMPTWMGGWEGIVWKPVMQLWASACGDWQWMVRHITLSIEIVGGGAYTVEAGLSSVQINQDFFFFFFFFFLFF